MRRPTRGCVGASLIVLWVAGIWAPAVAGAAEPHGEVIAFGGVHVVPLDRPGVLEDRTVLIRGDRIAGIEPGGTEVPDGARVIDARGKYLMPGLADMHVHVWCEGDLLLYVANGVTTIRNMSGSPNHLVWRERIASGELLGPTLFTSGPIIDADAPPSRATANTVEQARAVVVEQEGAGYDFLKVYSGLSPEVYEALLAAAREHGMPVAGHVPHAVGLEGVLRAGQDCIEHLDAYGLALEEAPPQDDANRFVRMVRAWEHGLMERIPRLARLTREAGAWVCPTLSVFDGRLAPEEVAEAALRRPEIRFVYPHQLRQWKETGGHAETHRSFRASKANRDRMTKALWDAGQRLLLGTDTANPFLVPGFSIHSELGHFVEAGLTPYEALRAGTHNAARFLGALDEFGAVSVGLRADLVLLNANPLEDVGHVAGRAGVMVRGRWYPETVLAGRLEDLAVAYAGQSPAATGRELMLQGNPPSSHEPGPPISLGPPEVHGPRSLHRSPVSRSTRYRPSPAGGTASTVNESPLPDDRLPA